MAREILSLMTTLDYYYDASIATDRVYTAGVRHRYRYNIMVAISALFIRPGWSQLISRRHKYSLWLSVLLYLWVAIILS